MSPRKSFVILISLLSATCFSCGNDDYFEDELLFVDVFYPNSNDSIKPQNDSTTTNTGTNNPDTIQTDTIKNNYDEITVYEIKKYMSQTSSGGSVQGADCYGDFLFQFKDHNETVFIYNLKEKKLIEKVMLSPNSKNHCNNVSFSRIFYNKDDKFPLLYVSGSSSGSYNKVQVYRITQNDTFNIEQIQEITLPNATAQNNLYWTGIIMDNEHNFMYIYANKNGAQIAKFSIPDITQKDIQLTDNDIIDKFTVEKFTHQQGAVIKNNLLFVFDGVPSWGDTNYLRIIDLIRKEDKAIINIMEKGFNAEAEGAFIYNRRLYCATNSGGIFQIVLK